MNPTKTTKLPPNNSISFKILDNDYEAKYPNNGQFIDIETMKVHLTDGTYHTISTGTDIAAQRAKYTVDMIAFFNICCPKIKESLTLKSFSKLEALENRKILNMYIKVIHPWLMAWQDFLNSDDDDQQEEGKGND